MPHKPTLQPKVCQRANKANAGRISKYFFLPFKIITTFDTQTNPTKTMNLVLTMVNKDEREKHQLVTRVWQKWRFSASQSAKWRMVKTANFL
jgi:hypothetical protein